MGRADREYLAYKPDYAVPPGETLLETMESLGMSQAELARRTDRPVKTINEIIKGKTAITHDTALQFEHVLGVPARFWNNLERNYREALATLEERKRLAEHSDWLCKMPVKFLVEKMFIRDLPDEQKLIDVLKFFGVASPEAWGKIWLCPENVAYRRSRAFQSDPGAVAAWVRIGELKAQDIACQPFNKTSFRQVLDQIRRLTTTEPSVFQHKVPCLCAQAGVAVVFYPEVPRSRLCGVARWLSPDKALIQLSLRYKTDDQLWFTFFHEAAHILLHGKREVFLEEGEKTDDKREREADTFSADYLIPPAQIKAFRATGKRSKAAIREFASTLGISAGIVVGRLQHDRVIERSHCNDLKKRFEWAKPESRSRESQ